MTEERAKIGVGVLIVKDGREVLLGKRKNAHGSGEYNTPGGHVEYGETMEDAARREITEECGLEIKNLRLLCVFDLLTYFPKHYVGIGFTAEWQAGEPKVLEPDRIESWEWFGIDDIPENVFSSTGAYIEAYKTGRVHFSFPKPDM